jgi:hypothetical protein
MRTRTLIPLLLAQFLAIPLVPNGFAFAQAEQVQQTVRAPAEPQPEQPIDKLLLKKPLVDQVDGYFRLAQVSLRELDELDDLLKHAKAEPTPALRAMKVAAVELKIADEKARLTMRQARLANAEKLYGHGTASARQAKLLRAGGPSLKALPAVALGAGVIFAGGAAADQVSEVRAVSVNAEGPAPIRLEKSNIGDSEISGLDADSAIKGNNSTVSGPGRIAKSRGAR